MAADFGETGPCFTEVYSSSFIKSDAPAVERTRKILCSRSDHGGTAAGGEVCPRDLLEGLA